MALYKFRYYYIIIIIQSRDANFKPGGWRYTIPAYGSTINKLSDGDTTPEEHKCNSKQNNHRKFNWQWYAQIMREIEIDVVAESEKKNKTGLSCRNSCNKHMRRQTKQHD